MYLLPGNPFSHAVEAYRVSGEARCPNLLSILPGPLWSLLKSGHLWTFGQVCVLSFLCVLNGSKGYHYQQQYHRTSCHCHGHGFLW